jgi:quercetin dioxygenase-like cupin family protein
MDDLILPDALQPMLPKVPTIAQIRRLEEYIASDLPEVATVTRHHFAPGIYLRELEIPAGTLLTGRTHTTEHYCIVSKGRIAVWTEQGMKMLEAGAHLPSYPGAKRVGLTLEHTVWTTIHLNPDDEQDLAVIEAKLFAEPMYVRPAPPIEALEMLED